MPPLNDYPDSFGAHKVSVFSHKGPVSYAAMTAGPVAGGDLVHPVEAGLHYFDCVLPIGLSDSGTFRVEGVAPAANPSTSRNGGQAQAWVLRWIVVATGAQVAALVDLSAEVIRLSAQGRY